MKLQNTFSICTIACNTVLLGMYTFVLVRMCKETKFRLFMIIITLLIISCFARVLNLISADHVDRIYHQGGDFVPWGTVNSIAYATADSVFLTAHWLFAFEYFSIANSMPLALKGINMAEKTQKIYKIAKWTGLTVYVVVPLALGFIFYFAYLTLYRDNMVKYDSLKTVQNYMTAFLTVC